MGKVKIYVDAGHGGSDPGAQGYGIKEKDITLKIAKKVQQYLNEYKNVAVKMSRTGDTYPTLTQRTNEANAWKASFFLSIHINSAGGVGYEDFRYQTLTSSSKTAKIQKIIHDEVLKQNGLRDRGMKKADLHVTRESHMDAILTENGFIDNKAESDKMKDPEWIAKVARGHVNGLAKAFNLKKKTSKPNKPSKPSGGTIKVGYKVTLSKSAKKYATGQTIPAYVKGKTYTVAQVGKGKVLLKEIMSWVKVKDVGGGKTNKKKQKFVEVKASELWVYNKPNWNAKDRIVHKGEVFTVKKTITVNGSKMHQLKSGLYITNNRSYVKVYSK